MEPSAGAVANGSGCFWRSIACCVSESGSRLGWWPSACKFVSRLVSCMLRTGPARGCTRGLFTSCAVAGLVLVRVLSRCVSPRGELRSISPGLVGRLRLVRRYHSLAAWCAMALREDPSFLCRSLLADCPVSTATSVSMLASALGVVCSDFHRPIGHTLEASHPRGRL